jgi:hypothetical protein
VYPAPIAQEETCMHEGRTVFAQLMDWLPKYELDKCVRRHRGDYHIRALTCYEQLPGRL